MTSLVQNYKKLRKAFVIRTVSEYGHTHGHGHHSMAHRA